MQVTIEFPYASNPPPITVGSCLFFTIQAIRGTSNREVRSCCRCGNYSSFEFQEQRRIECTTGVYQGHVPICSETSYRVDSNRIIKLLHDEGASPEYSTVWITWGKITASLRKQEER